MLTSNKIYKYVCKYIYISLYIPMDEMNDVGFKLLQKFCIILNIINVNNINNFVQVENIVCRRHHCIYKYLKTSSSSLVIFFVN